MENFDEKIAAANKKLNVAKEKIFSVKEKAKFQGKRWFLISYLGMLIVFFAFISKIFKIIDSFMIAAGLMPIALVMIIIGIIIYFVLIFVGFMLGKILKKYSLYLAKGFTYGSITVLVLTVVFFLWLKLG